MLCLLDKQQLLIDQFFHFLGQISFWIREPRSFFNQGIITGERRERGKLGSTVLDAHMGMGFGLVVREIQDIIVSFIVFHDRKNPFRPYVRRSADCARWSWRLPAGCFLLKLRFFHIFSGC